MVWKTGKTLWRGFTENGMCFGLVVGGVIPGLV